MPEYTDQLGNNFNFEKSPCRIISLVPSQSEFLWDIGLREELVGITKFCIHPDEMYRTVERVGGTKNLDLKKIRQIKPDLIIGNKEENEQSQIEQLQKDFPVWMSDIYTFEDAFDMMAGLGKVLSREKETSTIISSLKISIPKIKNLFAGQRVAYFIWNDPYMCAAKKTFIDYVLCYAGLSNAVERLERYPEINKETLKNLAPEFCFLSSEPFPFREKHVGELQKTLPHSKIMIVDGEMFSWYGSRLLKLENYLKELRTKIQET